MVFDTTYSLNRYLMIFSPFVRVNHDGQTIIFGFGLLIDETTRSFVLLFSTFLETMPNQLSLGLIFIDHDAVISKVITMVLSFTLHQHCLWHILNIFFEKINECCIMSNITCW